MRFRILAASLLLAGCSSSTPPTYALSPWGFAVKECEAYDPGYARIDCVASAQERLRPVMALPTAYTQAPCRADLGKFNSVLNSPASIEQQPRPRSLLERPFWEHQQDVEALEERWKQLDARYRLASTRW
jgi:hypothetical protein